MRMSTAFHQPSLTNVVVVVRLDAPSVSDALDSAALSQTVINF